MYYSKNCKPPCGLVAGGGYPWFPWSSLEISAQLVPTAIRQHEITWFNYWKCYIFFWFSTQGTYPTTVLEFFICVHVFSHFSHVRFFVTLWSVAHRAPLSMGFFQIRILEWVSIPSSKGSSQARIQNCTSCIVGRFFTTEPLGKPEFLMTCLNNFFFCAEKVIKRPTFLNDRKLYSL